MTDKNFKTGVDYLMSGNQLNDLNEFKKKTRADIEKSLSELTEVSNLTKYLPSPMVSQKVESIIAKLRKVLSDLS